MKKWNSLDIFLLLAVLLALLVLYFTFVKPIQFSRLIQREDVSRFAEIEILLPDDLGWLEDVVPVGEEFRNVYGNLDWKILGFERIRLGEREMMKVTAKVLITEDSSGLLRYGKYTLVPGGRIYLINDHYLLEGRVFRFRLLDEKALL